MEKNSLKAKVQVEVNRYREIDQNIHAAHKMSYNELVEEMNEDRKALE